MSEAITQLSIKALLSGAEDYVIPMYQRNYAWDEGEITQLIQDIIDYLPAKNAEAQNYYIGTLVVYERKETKPPTFETIDGQQRLTTLSLLASYLKNTHDPKDTHTDDLSWYQELRIHFDSREHSRKTFLTIFKGEFKSDPSEILGETDINTAILNGYRLIGKILPQKLKENCRGMKEFTSYLFDRVQIMRVKVPDDTDLNHYFEIMNNRGEQLEKHEVLKSKMMEVLNKIPDLEERQQSLYCLHAVWEACANMERYVQMGFPPAQRSAIFGDKDWGQFKLKDFDALRQTLHKAGNNHSVQAIAIDLMQIIDKPQGGTNKQGEEDEAPERFNTVINFANFLLHVLRATVEKDIPLDDKRLIPIFESEVLGSTEPIESVKQFIFALLRCKYLFDHYIIKREFINNKDSWSLKRLKWNDGGEKNQSGKPSYVNSFGNEDNIAPNEKIEGNTELNGKILMLLSAFHVSTPTMVYKHWLNAALHHLFHAEDEIRPRTYLNYLESVAKAFVFDRYLASDTDSKDYFDIVYTNKGVCQTTPNTVSDANLNHCLTFGHIENNLVFNFLDYLLWLEHRSYEPIKSYEFSFRSSVEHYYPQNPLPGHVRLSADVLNSFGNLCLISHSKNSKLSNYMPDAKMQHYKVGKIDSVKQYLMMKHQPWDMLAITKHYSEMRDVLLKCLGTK